MKLALTFLSLSLAFAIPGADAATALPADLKPIADGFMTYAVPETEQEEFWLKIERVTLDVEEWKLVEAVTKREVERIAASEGPNLEGLAVRRLYDEHGLDALVAALGLDSYGAYFCNALKEGHQAAPACRAAVRSMLASLPTLSAVMVEIDGDWYGSYREVVLYVQSGDDLKEHLRLSFDIVHEI